MGQITLVMVGGKKAPLWKYSGLLRMGNRWLQFRKASEDKLNEERGAKLLAKTGRNFDSSRGGARVQRVGNLLGRGE